MRQSMNAKASKEARPTLMFGDTRDAPSTGSILAKDQCPQSYLNPLHAVSGVFGLEEVLLLESIHTTKDLQDSRHQRELSGHPLLQDQQHVLSVPEA